MKFCPSNTFWWGIYGYFMNIWFPTQKLFANTHDLFQNDEAGATGKFKYSLLTFIYKLELMSE